MDELKKCKDCDTDKPRSEYNKAGGNSLQPYCKPCDKVRKAKWYEKNKERLNKESAERYKNKMVNNPDYHKKMYAENRDKILERNKQQQSKYRDKINERNRGYRRLDKYKKKANELFKKKYYSDPDASKKSYLKRKEWLERTGKSEEYKAKQRAFKAKYPDRYKDYELSDWAKANRTRRNREWSKMKRDTDIEYRIAHNIRSRTRIALKKWDTKKCASTEKLLGCTISEFKEYFCSLFQNGMTWERFMSGEIHIDHIIACSKFNLSIPEEQKRCFHYTNLQPLWAKDNFSKNNKDYSEWLMQTKS